MSRVKRPRGDLRQGFKRRLRDQFFLRFHMLLITGAVIFSGLGLSKLLWWLGLHTINIRYPIAVI